MGDVAPSHTFASSGSAPTVVNQMPQFAVDGIGEQDQISKGLFLAGKGPLEHVGSILPDPPDGYTKGSSIKKNKQKNHKGANSSNKGGSSATSSKGK